MTTESITDWKPNESHSRAIPSGLENEEDARGAMAKSLLGLEYCEYCSTVIHNDKDTIRIDGYVFCCEECTKAYEGEET